MTTRVAALAFVAALALEGSVALARGQDPDPSQARASEPAQIDIPDLIRMIRKKAPDDQPARLGLSPPDAGYSATFSSKPSTGFTVGALGDVAFYRGDPATTGISSASVGATISSRSRCRCRRACTCSRARTASTSRATTASCGPRRTRSDWGRTRHRRTRSTCASIIFRHLRPRLPRRPAARLRGHRAVLQRAHQHRAR